MSATRCTCIWTARPFLRLVMDPGCPAFTLHVLREGLATMPERTGEA